MQRVFITILITCLFSFGGYAQHHGQLAEVLNANVVDSTFVFGKWDGHGGTEEQLTYLGSVTTFEGTTLKFMGRLYLFGHVPRASTRLYVFNKADEYLGYYSMGGKYELPNRLEHGMLIFDAHGRCNTTQLVDMRMGILPLFFKECKDGMGDLYYFTTESIF